MAGASGETQRVKFLNANWSAGTGDAGGRFALLIVTEDGERHAVELSPAELSAVTALVRPGVVLLRDPQPRTLIAANLLGEWLQQDWSAGQSRRSR